MQQLGDQGNLPLAVALQMVSQSSLTLQLSSLTSPNCSELSVSQYYLGRGPVFPDVFPLLPQVWQNGSAALALRLSLPHLLLHTQEGFEPVLWNNGRGSLGEDEHFVSLCFAALPYCECSCCEGIWGGTTEGREAEKLRAKSSQEDK